MSSSSKNNNELSDMEKGNMGKGGGGHDQSQSRHPNTNTNSSQPSNKNTEKEKFILCESLKKKLQSLEDAIGEDDKHDKPLKPKIQKVSYMLRRDDDKNMDTEKYYEPRMVSIGPLHHYKDKVKPAEKFKLKLAAHFIQEHSLDKVCLYNNIKEQIQELKKCYYEEDIKGIDDEDLAWMFLVDGCALLLYIHADVEGKLKDLKIKMDMAAFAQQDLFLLENQLPYQVLDELIKSTANNGADKLREAIDNFIHKIARQIRNLPERDDNHTRGLTSPQPAHLLELLWRDLVKCNEHIGEPTSPQPPHPRKSLWRRLVDCILSPAEPSGGTEKPENQQSKPYSFRNVNELKSAWIKFEPNTGGSLGDISFISHRFTGTLRLPSLAVDDSTKPKFLNLIAFEMCPDFDNDFQVTSYIWFLDSLIDHPDDVKELRKVHILDNALGSDEEVAKLFNEIGTDIVPNPGTYSTVKDDIQKHYKKKWKTWMAQVYHEHFSSPWTNVAFVAAIAVLLMTGAQTVYTILSYY